jgi:hypothetical protein
MSQRTKKLDDEMLITHPQAAEKEKTGRDDASRASEPSAAEVDRAQLSAELAAAPTEDERRKLIQSIQERFGNEVAEEIVSEVRLSRLSDEGKGGRLE